jgi:hypothetical protein
MLKLLFRLLPALNAGKELQNVKGWKNVQATSNGLAVILGLVVALIQLKWPDVYVTDAQLLELVTWLATGMAGVNGYLTVATTKKIGAK